MRVSREKFAENREKILDVAARLFREKGFDGIGLADIMKAAGLTHGGFYGHFSSKEDLIAQATARAAAGSVARWETYAKDGQEKGLSELCSSYLSAAHRDHPGQGCAFAALGADLARAPEPARSAMTEAMRTQFALLEALLPEKRGESLRETALVTFSTLVGAVVLARISDDPELSAELLAAAQKSVEGNAPKKSKN